MMLSVIQSRFSFFVISASFAFSAVNKYGIILCVSASLREKGNCCFPAYSRHIGRRVFCRLLPCLECEEPIWFCFLKPRPEGGITPGVPVQQFRHGLITSIRVANLLESAKLSKCRRSDTAA
jgi:hypothetical protein